MQKLKKIIRTLLDVMWLIYGFIYYQLAYWIPLSQRTPAKSHLAIIRLFCITRGKSNDFLSRLISLFDKPVKLPGNNGILGNLSDIHIQQISNTIEEQGYYIFENKLSMPVINELYQFARNADCSPRQLDINPQLIRQENIKYDPNHLLSPVYDIPHSSCFLNPTIRALLHDHSILAVAQNYLKTSPKVEPIAMWWSTPFSKYPQSESAQLFHFDMDRIKWIKFFIFLTEVTIENGPHVFVSKSHKTNAIPASLLQAGYARHNDEEVYKFYKQDDIKTFTVPAGTIIAEDTRGLHKGTVVSVNERLVLELQFSNSLFGALTQRIPSTHLKKEPFISFANHYKKLYKLYELSA